MNKIKINYQKINADQLHELSVIMNRHAYLPFTICYEDLIDDLLTLEMVELIGEVKLKQTKNINHLANLVDYEVKSYRHYINGKQIKEFKLIKK